MKLLVYRWNNYYQTDIEWVCKEQGVLFDTFAWKFEDKNVNDEFEKWFADSVDAAKYDALFSVNYFPILSKVAQEHQLKYISWSYDCPLNVSHIEETLGNPVNYFFCFDRIQAEQYIRAGFEAVHHLPLGVNRSRLKTLKPTSGDHRKYDAEVSLVGKLYESELQGIRALLDAYHQGYVDAVMEAQQKIYGYYLCDELITDDMIKKINISIKERYPATEFYLPKEALTFAMASGITRKERLILLTLLGRRYDTRLYSYNTSEVLQGVKICPPVDYLTEMPLVFACSKINLNPALRCIQSGVPLRAYDIMASGGFLLSSYQAELVEQYVYEEEMVVYESLEDALAKVDFYLKHEDLRANIAQKGQEKTLREHSMQQCMRDMLQIAGISA